MRFCENKQTSQKNVETLMVSKCFDIRYVVKTRTYIVLISTINQNVFNIDVRDPLDKTK